MKPNFKLQTSEETFAPHVLRDYNPSESVVEDEKVESFENLNHSNALVEEKMAYPV